MSLNMAEFVGKNLRSLRSNEDYSVGVFRENDKTSLVQVSTKLDFDNVKIENMTDDLVKSLHFNGTIYRVPNSCVEDTVSEEKEEEVVVEEMCHSIPKSVRFNEDLKNLTMGQVEECYDGTLMRLWWNNLRGKWQLSTTRRMNAFKSYWGSRKSFGRLFNETVKLDYNSLSTENDYTFVLVHPENRIVLHYSTPMVLHVSTFSHKENKEIESEVRCMDSTLVEKPKSFPEISSWDDLLKQVNSFVFLRGLIVKTRYVCDDKSEMILRVKLDRDQYTDQALVRGNTRSLLERYVQVRNDTNLLRTFLEYYPENDPEFCKFETDLMELASEIHNTYFMVHVDRSQSIKNVHTKYQKTLYDLHQKFLSHKAQNQKVVTTLPSVRDYLSSRSPVVLLSLLYKS